MAVPWVRFKLQGLSRSSECFEGLKAGGGEWDGAAGSRVFVPKFAVVEIKG